MAKLYCPNYLCQALNPETNRFCQQCRSPLPKRYLWAIGKEVESLQAGELLADRYLVKQSQIVLDTQPGFLPDSPGEISETVESYLKLSPYQLHVPQIYGLVQSHQNRATNILLLEQAPIYPEGASPQASPASLEGSLMPELAAAWSQSRGLRQLNWLWQIAQLWHPLSTQQAVSTLLQPELIRVEGAIVRLLELQFDGRKPPTLSDLGQLWQQWRSGTQSEIANFVDQLCQQLQRGQIRNSEQLVTVLDQGIAACSQAQSRQIQIATRTDQGPNRQRNEDACYPPSGAIWSIANPGMATATIAPQSSNLPDVVPLVIVCDGIGGHEGGNVASNLAIETVQQQLKSPLRSDSIEPNELISQLENVALAANDVISQRNDNEQRQERQRMGTTLVMALAHAHELYLTHVGDSRAYRITRTGCRQVTLDDDLAAREARLGYSLYRDALRQPGSGSLVQALGMNASSLLHPTVQRFVLDDDCLFLLCSDGLSDNDRVDQYWQTELLPVLQGEIDLATASQRLISLANSKNGHDNVTVGLVYCQVSSSTLKTPLNGALATNAISPDRSQDAPVTNSSGATTSTLKTRIIPDRRSSSNFFLTLLGIPLLLLLGGLIGYLLVPEVRSWTETLLEQSSSSVPEPAASAPPSPAEVSPTPSSTSTLTVGSLIQVNRSAIDGASQLPAAVLQRQPPGTPQPLPSNVLGRLPAGSVLQISSRQAISNQNYWLKLKVCSVPLGPNSSAPDIARPGASGWIEQATIAPLVTQSLSLTAAEVGQCATPPATDRG